MRFLFKKTLMRMVLALAIAMPALTTVQINSADAGHKNKRRAAVVAGAIIGGAIIYHNYRKNRRYRHHGGYYRSYGRRYVPRRVVRYRRHHRGYRHRHHRYGRVHYH